MKTHEDYLNQKRKEILQMISKEFDKSESDLQECVNVLKEWLKSQRHLPETPTDGQLEQFLNFNKYSVEKVKQRIDMYYTARSLVPDFFEGTNPNTAAMKHQSELTYYFPLPKLTPNYCRVMFCRINESSPPEKTNVERFFALGFNAFDVLMTEDFSLGFNFVIDCSYLKAGHMPKFTIMLLKKATFIIEKVYSNRVSGIHFIHAQPYLDILVTLLKTVLSKKVASRVQVHKNSDSLFQFIPKEILPKDIGGDDLSLKTLNDLWQQKLAAYKDRFDSLETLKVNEELRPAPLINDEILGYYGNFKKLSVD